MTDNKDSVEPSAVEDDRHCRVCGSLPTERELIVVRNNKDKKVDAVNTSVLICTKCFLEKGISEFCRREREKIIQSDVYESELQVNRQKQPRFRLFVYEELSKKTNLTWELRDLINSGAEEIEISPITARRYVEKMCSSSGLLKMIDDGKKVYVTFKIDKICSFINEKLDKE